MNSILARTTDRREYAHLKRPFRRKPSSLRPSHPETPASLPLPLGPDTLRIIGAPEDRKNTRL